MPVLTACCGWAHRDPLIYLRILNVLPVCHGTGFRIDIAEGVLEDRFLVGDEFTRYPVMLPEDAVLAD